MENHHIVKERHVPCETVFYFPPDAAGERDLP